MQLPLTSNSIIAWYDPDPRFITYANKSSKIYSILNRIDGRPVIQTNISLQPSWSSTVMNGRPGLVFSGTQFMIGNWQKNTILNGIPTMGVSIVMKPTGLQTSCPLCLAWSQQPFTSEFDMIIGFDGTLAPQRFDDSGIGFDVFNPTNFFITEVP